MAEEIKDKTLSAYIDQAMRRLPAAPVLEAPKFTTWPNPVTDQVIADLQAENERLRKENAELRRDTANEISQELARRTGGNDSMLIRAFRLWIKQTYLDAAKEKQ